jgi:hypothetical protein
VNPDLSVAGIAKCQLHVAVSSVACRDHSNTCRFIDTIARREELGSVMPATCVWIGSDKLKWAEGEDWQADVFICAKQWVPELAIKKAITSSMIDAIFLVTKASDWHCHCLDLVGRLVIAFMGKTKRSFDRSPKLFNATPRTSGPLSPMGDWPEAFWIDTERINEVMATCVRALHYRDTSEKALSVADFSGKSGVIRVP